jgi:hypothetical protein
MKHRPYLRAYMAGITVPTVFLLVLVSLERIFRPVPAQMEWGLIFPLIIVPNAFGVWNMLYVKLQQRWRLAIGVHGAALPFLIGPTVFALAWSTGLVKFGDHALFYFGAIWIPYWFFVFVPFVAIAGYYLIWKHAVGYLNRELDLPG